MGTRSLRQPMANSSRPCRMHAVSGASVVDTRHVRDSRVILCVHRDVAESSVAKSDAQSPCRFGSVNSRCVGFGSVSSHRVSFAMDIYGTTDSRRQRSLISLTMLPPHLPYRTAAPPSPVPPTGSPPANSMGGDSCSPSPTIPPFPAPQYPSPRSP